MRLSKLSNEVERRSKVFEQVFEEDDGDADVEEVMSYTWLGSRTADFLLSRPISFSTLGVLVTL